MGDVDVRALVLALQGFEHRASEGARAAADAMAEAAQGGMKALLGQSSHSRRTKTPSPPGSPPARVSGRLQGSVKARPPFQVGAARWEAHTASGIVYARIHEVGGWAGRGHKSYLPPRPYVLPAVIKMRAELEARARAAFIREVGL